MKRWPIAAVVASSLAVAAVGGAARLVPLPEGFFSPPSTVVTWADGTPAHVFLSPDEKLRVPVSLDAVDPAYLDALLAFEDQRFFSHPGVDVLAVLRATVMNAVAGRVVSGASTLTMQLARMREPRRRTLGAKIVEVFRALQLEARFDKRTLLEAYVTYAPFGGNREGIETASLAFFGHGARHLSPDEIALLLAVPQRPTPRAPGPGNIERATAARDHVLAVLRSRGRFVDAPDPRPVPNTVEPLPREIPHLAYDLKARASGSGATANGLSSRTVLGTTLDRATQRAAEAQVAARRQGLQRRGIDGGAVVVTEHATGEVRALVGSLDFWSGAHGSQIPGFFLPRSSGSTLKPLIYGLALERGLVLPTTLLADVPRSFPGYHPENFDGRFEGAVPAHEALARSLNLPFVDLLATLGVDRFVGALAAAGVESLHGEFGQHGLSAAVGGVELSPLELAQLYGAIATDGAVRPLFWRAGAQPGPARPFVSAAVAHLVRDALDDRDRPDFADRSRARGHAPGVFWKTGTSFAHRDAWAAGSDGVHTVVVWLGNPDRRSSPALVGAEAAGPLFFDVLEALPGGRPKDKSPPAGLAAIEVCAVSGAVAGPDCPHRRTGLAPRHRVPTVTCPLHRALWIDAQSGLEVDPGCAGAAPERQVFELWPADVLRHLGPGVRRLPGPPARDPRCAAIPRSRPEIRSPPVGVKMLLPGVAPDAQEVPLEAHGEGDLTWFVDGTYLGSAPATERLWWTPSAGRHEVLVMDGAGQASTRWVEVIAP